MGRGVPKVKTPRDPRDRCVELLEGESTLEEIGAAVGLSGSRALARAFKRWTGRTPSEHRRLSRGAEG